MDKKVQPPPLTLRTLVIEMLGESAGASIESGIAVNTQFIAKAVESTKRNINHAEVLGNLDLILAKEVDMGCFIKDGEDQYKISPDVSGETASFDAKSGKLILGEFDINKQFQKVSKQLEIVNKQQISIIEDLKIVKKELADMKTKGVKIASFKGKEKGRKRQSKQNFLYWSIMHYLLSGASFCSHNQWGPKKKFPRRNLRGLNFGYSNLIAVLNGNIFQKKLHKVFLQ